MGFWEWMGFENPRDSPKTEQPKEGLPQVTDNVRDSGQTFVFGRSNAGEQVDEKAAMQIPTVYACVRLLAESIAALPLHLYRMTDDNGNKEKARDHPLYKILYRQPNPEMTSFVFWETLMTHLLLWGNAYAQIVRDGKNTVLGLYRINFEGETLYVFDLLVPEIFHESQKRKKGESAPQSEETKPVNTRKGFYPDDIAGTFGVPVEEHLKESEVKQIDGYVSMSILTGKAPGTSAD